MSINLVHFSYFGFILLQKIDSMKENIHATERRLQNRKMLN